MGRSRRSGPQEVKTTRRSPQEVGDDTVTGSTTGALKLGAGHVVQPRLNAPTEKILLCADSNMGKSYVYMRMAQLAFEDPNNWTDADGGERKYTGPRFFIFDFDDTAPKFMGEGYEFPHLFTTNGGNVWPYPCPTWADTINALVSIRSNMRDGDWVVFDPIRELYEQSQFVIAGDRGIELDEKMIANILGGRGFGSFSGNEWNAVQRTFYTVFNRLNKNTTAKINILALTHVADIVMDRGERREVLTTFDSIGLKPVGPPSLPGKVDTIVFLYAVAIIAETERGKKFIERVARRMTTVKDRGQPYWETRDFEFDFFEELKTQRLTGTKPLTITANEIKEADSIEPASPVLKEAAAAHAEAGGDEESSDDN